MKVTTDMIETAQLTRPPRLRSAPSYAGWLRRFAFRHDAVKAAVLNNAALVIELQRIEIERLGRALEEAASGVPFPPPGSQADTYGPDQMIPNESSQADPDPPEVM